MDDSITDEVSDTMAENRDEFRLLFRLYSDAACEFIGPLSRSKRFARFNDETDRRSDSVHAMSVAHALNAMYLDVLLANKRIQTCVGSHITTGEASASKAGRAGKKKRDKVAAVEANSISGFIIHSMATCAQRLADEFPADGGDEYKPACGILCCGVVAGLGLLLSSALQLSPRESTLPDAQVRELGEILGRKLKLKSRYETMEKFLDGWIYEYWNTQERTSSFGQGDETDPEAALTIFWTTQLLHLHQSVSHLGEVARSSKLSMDDLVVGVAPDQEEAMRVLRAGAASVAEAHVKAWIVGYHSGLVQSLSRGTLYWLAIYLMNSRKLECEDICSYVLKIVFDKFFVGGCFLFAGVDAVASANVSYSGEVLGILLYCDLFRRMANAGGRTRGKRNRGKEELQAAIGLGSLSPSIFAKHYPNIALHLGLLKTVHERQLWYRKGSGQALGDHLWRVCLISCGILLADEILDRHARKVLGVQQFVPPPKDDFPKDLRFIKDDVIDLIRMGGEARNEASYSMILYGPPGSAKTSLAKQIAYNLDWPFLEIGPRNFLRQGGDKIDAQADRIFRFCGYLRDVVILFDELEELIRDREMEEADRESRLLTTSMLPRIQELREQRSAVFIFATNRLKTLDIAATRLGRFDVIKFVGYPDQESKIRLLKKAAKTAGDRYPVLRQALETFAEDSQLADLTENLAFGDFNYLLGRVRRWDLAKERSKNNIRAQKLHAKITELFSQHQRTSNTKIIPLLKEYDSLRTYDRPP